MVSEAVMKPQFSQLGTPLPEIASPFVVLLDANDEDWRDLSVLREQVESLLEAGCRYFICSGDASEDLHDFIDDIIVEKGHEGIVTTYHEGDSDDEIVAFFQLATEEMKGALVLVRSSDWMETFAERK